MVPNFSAILMLLSLGGLVGVAVTDVLEDTLRSDMILENSLVIVVFSLVSYLALGPWVG